MAAKVRFWVALAVRRRWEEGGRESVVWRG
jgi:hypothetical protein